MSDTQVTAKIPVGATHLYVNLIDENRFLFSYPEVPGKQKIAVGPIDVQP